MQSFKKYKELLTGVFFLSIAAVYLFLSKDIKAVKGATIGAEFVPRIYGSILAFLSVLQIILSAVKLRKAETESGSGSIRKDVVLNVILFFVSIIVYGLVFKSLGFIISSVLLLFVLCNLLMPTGTKRNYVVMAIFSVVLPIIVYYLFKTVLHLSLPDGILYNLL